MSWRDRPKGPRVQFICGSAWVVHMDQAPTLGVRVYSDGEMYIVTQVDDLGSGRLRAFVKHDPSWSAGLPPNNIGAPRVNFNR